MSRGDWDLLRAYARGYMAAASVRALELTICRREALAIVALRELGVSPAASQAILEQARHEAQLVTGDVTENVTDEARRILAAELVLAILRTRLAAMQSEAAA